MQVDQIPLGYKLTEVGIIPSDWDVVKLGEIGTFKNGINKGKEEFGFGYPFVNLLDIFGTTKLDNSKLFGLVNTTSSERISYNLKTGDVLFVRSSVKPEGVGITAVVTEDLINSVYSGFLIRFRDSNIFDLEYKRHCFYEYNFRKSLVDSSTVSANTNINQDSLKNIYIAIPPIEEQKRIAQVLSDIDELIRSLDELIIKKRNIKQGTMQLLLTGKQRLPGYSGEWEVKKLDEISDVRDGTHDSPKYYNQGVMFITSKNIINGRLDLQDITYISEQDAININKRSIVHKGDILMSMIGTIGNCVLIKDDPDFCIKNVALIKPNLNINNFYLVQFLNSGIFQNILTNNLDGGIQKFISLGKLRELSFSLPPLEEQKAIARILSDMDEEIEVLEQKRDKYQDIKKGMMQELLTGKTRLV